MKLKKIPKKFDHFIIELEALFGTKRPPIAIIELDTKKEFELFTNTPYDKKLLGCNVAFFVVMWNKKYYEKIGITQKRTFQLVKHELVHIFFKKKFGTNKPKWLNEGLAMHLSGQKLKEQIDVSIELSDLLELYSPDLWKPKDAKISYHKSFEIIRRILQNDLNRGTKK